MKFIKSISLKATFLQVLLLVNTFLLVSTCSFSQISDDFNDNDFLNNPTWAGTINDYIVNTSFQLQLNAAVAGTSYLTISHNLIDFNDKEWRFWIKQSFSGSASNYGRVYLISDLADISSNPDGVYLQFGEAGSTDAIRLMQRNGGVTSQICASADGSIANSFAVGIKVIRNSAGNWSLNIDFNGGTFYSSISTGDETTVPSGGTFGFLNVYTAGNATKFYLDDVYVGDQVFDTTPPAIVNIQVMSNNQLDLLFSEPITTTSAQNTTNYDILPFNSVSVATIDGTNPALVHLQSSSAFVNGQTYNLICTNMEDVNGNIATSQTINFTYLYAETPLPGDIIINEFMADPSPVVGLPEAEFVEIYNVSNKIFNLNGWKLGDNSTYGTIDSGWLFPNEYKVLCPTNSVPNFTNAIGVTSFPSLNNDSDDIVLKDNVGTELDKISYTIDWYKDAAKKDGGWTIERIHPLAPCSSTSNWRAAVDPLGGTPGTQNSVYDNTPDTTPAQIISTAIVDTNQVEVIFNKMVDSASLQTAFITTNPLLTEASRTIQSLHTDRMSVAFSTPIKEGVYYTMTVTNVEDCWGNSGTVQTKFVAASQPTIGDVVINEILFNPITGGSDWVELYNKSDKLLDLKNWKIARIVNGETKDYKTITKTYLLKPADYVVFSADTNFIQANYPAFVPNKFYQLTLPTMSNDTGSVVVTFPKMTLVDTTDALMDQLIYSSKWHFKLIDDKKGKSLERLDPNLTTQNAANWHTAAESIGFGTPGGKNSQYYPALYNGNIQLSSETISPDNDGFEDVLVINYQMNTPGMTATFVVFDGTGRKIKTIVQNELLGMEGTIVWDGIREDGQKALIGTYVLMVEAFAADGGEKFVTKKPFVVAGKM
ncbi:MAG: lamin tail domain-containing protein [Crocinitomicaceae bacterium]|nr:lamin tail domain-containing protein [Crocinitomicaceae bacterium]